MERQTHTDIYKYCIFLFICLFIASVEIDWIAYLSTNSMLSNRFWYLYNHRIHIFRMITSRAPWSSATVYQMRRTPYYYPRLRIGWAHVAKLVKAVSASHRNSRVYQEGAVNSIGPCLCPLWRHTQIPRGSYFLVNSFRCLGLCDWSADHGTRFKNTVRNPWCFVDIVTKYNRDLTLIQWDKVDRRITTGSWNWYFKTNFHSSKSSDRQSKT